jgi:hypothetical protein
MSDDRDERLARLVARKVRNNGLDPRWWVTNAYPWARRRARDVAFKTVMDVRRRQAFDHYEADWDNLVILDACRFDMFRALSNLPGELERRRSKGSATPEWLYRHFADRDAHDTVYVTANPMYRATEWVGADLSGTFHDVIDLSTGPFVEDGTTMPYTVAAAATWAATAYPDKRLLVHFMQPHHPFVGEFAREHGLLDPELRLRQFVEEGETTIETDAWEAWRRQVKRGDTTAAELRRAYWDNLELALPAVRDLVDSLSGLTVVSSDHGNMLGERATPFRERVWGHPMYYQTPELTGVPWLVVDPSASRRETVADPPVAGVSPTDDDLDDRLSALGYV